jgi:hypothetical protein
MDTFVLNGKTYFDVECSCGQGEVVEITAEQVAVVSKDPVAGLYVIGETNQMAIVEFWDKHAKMGHELRPTLCEMAPLNKAENN